MPSTITISNRMAKLLFPIKSLKVIHLKITTTLPKGQRVDCRNCFVYRINSCHMCPFLSGLRKHQDTCTESIDGVICTIFPLRRVWANCSIQNVVVVQKRTWQKQSQRIFDLGADSIKKICHLTSIGISIVEIRRSYERLISTMGFPILIRWHLYIESGPSLFHCLFSGWSTICYSCNTIYIAVLFESVWWLVIGCDLFPPGHLRSLW